MIPKIEDCQIKEQTGGLVAKLFACQEGKGELAAEIVGFESGIERPGEYE